MVRVLASNVVNRGFEPWSGEIKVYVIGICCILTNHVALSKNRLAQNQNKVQGGAECLSADCGFSDIAL